VKSVMSPASTSGSLRLIEANSAFSTERARRKRHPTTPQRECYELSERLKRCCAASRLRLGRRRHHGASRCSTPGRGTKGPNPALAHMRLRSRMARQCTSHRQPTRTLRRRLRLPLARPPRRVLSRPSQESSNGSHPTSRIAFCERSPVPRSKVVPRIASLYSAPTRLTAKQTSCVDWVAASRKVGLRTNWSQALAARVAEPVNPFARKTCS
jgi:hypothetical protein